MNIARRHCIALGLLVTAHGTCIAASADRWSYVMTMAGKNYMQEWIVSEDKMSAPKGKGFLRVVLNDRDTLLAFFRTWNKSGTSNNHYVIIAKTTGVATEIDDMAGFDYGPGPEQWAAPTTTVGH